MDNHVNKNLLFTISTASAALLMWSFAYQDSFYGSFGIEVERYVDGLSELTLLSLPAINAFWLLTTLFVIGVYLLIYLTGLPDNKQQEDGTAKREEDTDKLISDFKNRKLSWGKLRSFWKLIRANSLARRLLWLLLPVFLLILNNIAEGRQWLSSEYTTPIRLLLTIMMFLIYIFIAVDHHDNFLEGHRRPLFLKNWFPAITLLVLLIFANGLARTFGQWKAQSMIEDKIQVVLLNDYKPVKFESESYYISHTKRYIFFFDESDSVIVHPLNQNTSIRFPNRKN